MATDKRKKPKRPKKSTRKTRETTEPKTLPVGAVAVRFQGEMAPFNKVQEALQSKLYSQLVSHFLEVRTSGDGGFPFGATVPTNPAWSPVEILYHRLQVDSSTYECSYLEGSGIYKKPSGTTDPTIDSTTFQNFLDALDGGDLTNTTGLTRSNLHNQLSGAPSIVIWHACYVIIDLVSPTLKFRVDLNNKRFAFDNSIRDCGTRYFVLKHLDTMGSVIQPSSSTPTCQRAYFSVGKPPDNLGDDVIDQFNIYLRIDLPTAVDYVTIDPFIKNRGGH